MTVNYINPIAFHLFSKPIYWYGIIIATTVLIAYLMAEKEATKRGLPDEIMLDLLLRMLPVAFIFARLYYVVFRWDNYSKNPGEIIAIWDGGIAIYGGLIGGFLVLYFFAKKRNIKIIKLLDIIAPSLLIGQALGRWGNFFNHEAFGGIVTRKYLQDRLIPNFIIENMYIDGAYRQPTFLYESLWCVVALIILLVVRNKLSQSEVFVGYLILYGTERFIVEGMRTDSLYLGVFRISQVLSLVFVIGSLIYLILLNTKYKDKKILYINS
ncbi:prolipoprotein diacylglyceryl transferase [Gemella bergeri ATCC 700627]|uniref:Phosphatidylglycerol--prolipoprotein diacylglyceryl transferase n=1 Tax=Gemella bergeri ATCC 700627 TaxID=1321820 RepID=U2S2Z4_9BACL|nr:prolipoprotein diacylglyceryl transferase [Gemella bergeri]ERK57172.1 prolipoprotein diacylglyceryl transferase [Gemella bergeri ATCC 700627]